MNPALIAIVAIFGTLLLLWAIFIVVRQAKPRPMPPFMSFLVDSWLRRIVFSPSHYMQRVGIEPGMRVLELGPGSGFNSIEASRRAGAAGKVCCVDISTELLARLKDKTAAADIDNIWPILGDGQRLPFKDSCFDLAYLVTVVGEIPHREQAFSELHRVLRPGGALSVAEYIFDPDYPRRRSVIEWARRAGFEPCRHFGNVLNYVVNFRRGHA